MALINVNTDPTRRELRQFGFIWLGFLAFFGAMAWFKFGQPTVAIGLWIAAVVVPVIGWLIPALMRLVFLGMSYAAWPIGFVVSHVILALGRNAAEARNAVRLSVGWSTTHEEVDRFLTRFPAVVRQVRDGLSG